MPPAEEGLGANRALPPSSRAWNGVTGSPHAVETTKKRIGAVDDRTSRRITKRRRPGGNGARAGCDI